MMPSVSMMVMPSLMASKAARAAALSSMEHTLLITDSRGAAEHLYCNRPEAGTQEGAKDGGFCIVIWGRAVYNVS